MQVVSLAWGIMALLGFFVGVIPCFGWVNWFNIPFAAAGLILSIIAYVQGRPGFRNPSAWAIALCLIAVLIGAKRLVLGVGIF